MVEGGLNLCLEIVGMCRCEWCENMRTLAGSRPECESSHLNCFFSPACPHDTSGNVGGIGDVFGMCVGCVWHLGNRVSSGGGTLVGNSRIENVNVETTSAN